MNADSDAGIVDLSDASQGGARELEASLTLSEPQTQVRLRLPRGEAGRAEALFAGKSWAAKHYWHEGELMVYEFDGPLPAGPVRLRIPFAPA
jgi:hypothetical protein